MPLPSDAITAKWKPAEPQAVGRGIYTSPRARPTAFVGPLTVMVPLACAAGPPAGPDRLRSLGNQPIHSGYETWLSGAGGSMGV
jgi:hypothetical protein